MSLLTIRLNDGGYNLWPGKSGWLDLAFWLRACTWRAANLLTRHRNRHRCKRLIRPIADFDEVMKCGGQQLSLMPSFHRAVV